MYLQPEWLHATSVKLGFIKFHTALGAADIGAGVLLGLFTENKKENAPIISLLAQPIRAYGY